MITKGPLIIGCDVTKMSVATLSTLINPEVIAVNQDLLDIQGKRVVLTSSQLSNASSTVIVTSCSSASSSMEARRHQWIYNSQDGSIESIFNGRCLSIVRCGYS